VRKRQVGTRHRVARDQVAAAGGGDHAYSESNVGNVTERRDLRQPTSSKRALERGYIANGRDAPHRQTSKSIRPVRSLPAMTSSESSVTGFSLCKLRHAGTARPHALHQQTCEMQATHRATSSMRVAQPCLRSEGATHRARTPSWQATSDAVSGLSSRAGRWA
jgi:hypothetical protein